MPSTCPKCRQVVPEDIVCCAEVEYTWKCNKCSKVSTGFAIPYGKCFLCGGHLELIRGHEFEDPMKVRPIRDAVQFELNSYHFYRLALDKAEDPLLIVSHSTAYFTTCFRIRFEIPMMPSLSCPSLTD